MRVRVTNVALLQVKLLQQLKSKDTDGSAGIKKSEDQYEQDEAMATNFHSTTLQRLCT